MIVTWDFFFFLTSYEMLGGKPFICIYLLRIIFIFSVTTLRDNIDVSGMCFKNFRK